MPRLACLLGSLGWLVLQLFGGSCGLVVGRTVVVFGVVFLFCFRILWFVVFRAGSLGFVLLVVLGCRCTVVLGVFGRLGFCVGLFVLVFLLVWFFGWLLFVVCLLRGFWLFVGL